MSRILIDTSAYSQLRRGRPEALEAVRDADEIYLSPVVLGELRAGFGAGSRRDQNEGVLQTFLASPRVSGLTIEDETSRRYAIILSGLRERGTPIPTNDVWIAASAMEHGLEVLTYDGDFEKVPQIATRLLATPWAG